MMDELTLSPDAEAIVVELLDLARRYVVSHELLSSTQARLVEHNDRALEIQEQVARESAGGTFGMLRQFGRMVDAMAGEEEANDG
jgi:hypothetical protein